MILDGDILNFFKEINKEVEISEYEGKETFIFTINYFTFDILASIYLDRDLGMLKFQMEFKNPKVMESVPQALNILNQNSTILKAYYDRLNDSVYIVSNHFVNEENIISVLSFLMDSVYKIDSMYIENLYNSIYDDTYDLFDDDFEKKHENTSIEDDFNELLNLLNSNKKE